MYLYIFKKRNKKHHRGIISSCWFKILILHDNGGCFLLSIVKMSYLKSNIRSSLRPAILSKYRLCHQVFSNEFCELFKNTFSTEHLCTTASQAYSSQILLTEVRATCSPIQIRLYVLLL